MKTLQVEYPITGGGSIGVKRAQVFNVFASQVTILEAARHAISG